MPSYALIAEPDPGQAQIYRHLALAEGFEARMARDGEQALAALRSQGAPGLTIAELSLPRVDGFKLLEEIHRLGGEGPVVVVSAFRALREVAQRLKKELGISALLARSAPADALRRAVKKALAASAAPHGPAPSTSAPPPGAAVLAIDEERAEEVRLQRLDEMQLVDEGAAQDEELRRIAEETAREFDVPAAAINLVLEDQDWFKAHFGLSGQLLEQRGGPRQSSFCAHVVQARQPLVVPDAASHPAFADNPRVKEGTVGSYAGAPLEMPSGDVLGTLCLIDNKPRSFGAEEIDKLVVLARRVAGELELRAAANRQKKERSRLPKELQEQLAADKQLATALSYLSAVLDGIDNGVFLLDPKGKVVFANQALADLFAVTTDSLIGRHRDEIVGEAAQMSSDPDEFLRRLRTSDQGPYALRGEFEMEKPRRRYLRWTMRPVQLGEGIGQVAVLTDMSAEMELLQEREQLARTDPVTGLINRRGGEEVLDRETSRAQRFGSRISVALVDLDHLKLINDRHGHGAGDEALRAVGQVMGSAMRGIDVAVRWGGDELLAILPATGLLGARSFGERVRAQVEQLPAQIMHGVTLSVGVAEMQPGEDWVDALRRADAKLYEAKDAGRNRVA